MGVDAADWQRQVTVNVASTGQIPVDITKQSLSPLTVTPTLRGQDWERDQINAGLTNIGAGAEVQLDSYSGSGISCALRFKVDYAYMVYRVYLDSVMAFEGSVGAVWDNWGGEHYEEGMKAKVTIYDTVTGIYAIVRDYGFNYPFASSIAVKAYNPDGAAHNVNNVVVAFLVPA